MIIGCGEGIFETAERRFCNQSSGMTNMAKKNPCQDHIASTLLALLHQTRRVTRQVMFTETVNKERLLQQHHAILGAIRERNPEKARKAILTHLDYAENYFVTHSSISTGD